MNAQVEVTALIALITDPKAAAARLAELKAAEQALAEREAAAIAAEAKAAERSAELDARDAAARAREVALHQRSLQLDHQHSQTVALFQELRTRDDAMKRRLATYAGILDGFFVESLQSLPSWAEVEAALAGPKDAHYAEPMFDPIAPVAAKTHRSLRRVKI